MHAISEATLFHPIPCYPSTQRTMHRLSSQFLLVGRFVVPPRALFKLGSTTEIICFHSQLWLIWEFCEDASSLLANMRGWGSADPHVYQLHHCLGCRTLEAPNTQMSHISPLVKGTERGWGGRRSNDESPEEAIGGSRAALLQVHKAFLHLWRWG